MERTVLFKTHRLFPHVLLNRFAQKSGISDASWQGSVFIKTERLANGGLGNDARHHHQSNHTQKSEQRQGNEQPPWNDNLNWQKMLKGIEFVAADPRCLLRIVKDHGWHNRLREQSRS